MKSTKERIYVCHTFYHVYITLLKELKLREEMGDAWHPGATLVLSKMSNNFQDLKSRAEAVGIFEEVLEYDEKREDFFPELAKYKVDRGGLRNLFQRILLTSRFAKLQEAFVPTDFRTYKDIYVFCDTDPIGPYLAKHRIRFHSVEDGLNCIANYDAARYDNRGAYPLKAFLSEYLNLIYVQYGHNKYVIDMEVNDISRIKYPNFRKYKEVPRAALRERLTEADKDLIMTVFIRNKEELLAQVKAASEAGDGILVLTDPLCTLDVRERIFRDIVDMFKDQGTIFLKPHPRDNLDYATLFPDLPRIDASVPMELIGFLPGARFAKAVGVLTEMSDFQYADQVIRLGEDFMDKYEDPRIHRQNEQI